MALPTGGPASRAKAPAGREASATTQQIVSLLIVLHLFCVFLAVTSYTRRSPLQARLLNMLAAYTRTINLAPAQAPYHLTQYDSLIGINPQDDEHFIELEITGENGEREFHNLNEFTIALPDAKRRYRTLSSEMVYNLDESEDANRLTEIAKAAAAFGLRRHGADTGVLRLKHHMSQPRLLANLQAGFPPDPLASQYIVTRYEADVLLDDDGEVQLVKREDRSQVAPVRPASPSTAAQKGS
jgi:hypothetical protein